MIRRLLLLFLTTASLASASVHMLVIQGAGGTSEYDQAFSEATSIWIQLANKAGATATLLSPDSSGPETKQSIESWIASPERENASSTWIIYQGHGTFNAAGAKLNLAGEDLSAKELGDWLKGKPGELVFIHGGSASAPFIRELSGENRVIITATRSAVELNYARFGERLVNALSDRSSDIDRDNTVSLLEAFLSASNSVETFYKEAGRLTSEHALIDDNGDGKGTPASLYSGLRVQSAKDGTPVDGRLARKLSLNSAASNDALSPQQLEQRNQLEQQLESLYSKKNDMDEGRYYEQLEEILNQLSVFYTFEDES